MLVDGVVVDGAGVVVKDGVVDVRVVATVDAVVEDNGGVEEAAVGVVVGDVV